MKMDKKLTGSLDAKLSADHRLAEMLLEGTHEGFERIYSQLKGPVLKYVFRKVNCRQAAEELTQDVFVKLFRFRDSYSPAYPFSSWFWTLVRNATHDWLRGRMVAPALIADGSVEESQDLGPNAEQSLIRKTWRRELRSRVKSLTKLQRRVFWLRFVHHLSHEEIAARLDISINSVKCLLYRARECLRLELDLTPA